MQTAAVRVVSDGELPDGHGWMVLTDPLGVVRGFVAASRVNDPATSCELARGLLMAQRERLLVGPQAAS